MNFSSDNWAGAAARVTTALAEAADGFAPPYGADDLTAEVTAEFSRLFETDVTVFFVATGTAANALALSAYARPGGAVFCHDEAHVAVDEGGAPEFIGDIRLVGIGGEESKIAPVGLEQALARFPEGFVHHGQPVAVTISQLTELGTAYTASEIARLTAIAHDAGLAVHMDGARFGNAVAALGATPAELTWKAGIDVMSFGGTKGGCWAAEAVLFFHPGDAEDFAFRRKRAGHLFSKSRFVAAQLGAFLREGAWLEWAAHANRLAKRLADGIEAEGGRLAVTPAGNQVFAIIDDARLAVLRKAGALFYEWESTALPADRRPRDGETMIRLVTSFANSADEVDLFLTVLHG